MSFALIEQTPTGGYGYRFLVYAGMISPDDRQRLRELHIRRVIVEPAHAAELLSAIGEVLAGF